MINSNESNELIEDINKQRAFSIDLSKEIKKDISEQSLPLYIAEDTLKVRNKIYNTAKRNWIMGPNVWGFISLNDDLNTILCCCI